MLQMKAVREVREVSEELEQTLTSGESSDDGLYERQSFEGRGKLFRVALAIGAAVGATALIAHQFGPSEVVETKSTKHFEVLQNVPPFAGSASQITSVNQLQGITPQDATAGASAAQKAGYPVLTGQAAANAAAAAAQNPLAPQNNLVDGNICNDDEELFGDLCYKKCSLLTNSAFPKRISAFTCDKLQHQNKLTGFLHSKTNLLPCSGYDVAGDMIGGGCPHKPGDCLADEEKYLDVCFKKCTLLTGGVYFRRTGPDSCCKSALTECVFPSNSKISPKFNVGGDNSGVDAKPHPPEVKFTEAR